MHIIQSNIILALLMTLFSLMLSAGQGLHNEPHPAIEWQDEVIYHVMQRSFMTRRATGTETSRGS